MHAHFYDGMHKCRHYCLQSAGCVVVPLVRNEQIALHVGEPKDEVGAEGRVDVPREVLAI